jgi:hypothetical protein
MNAAPLFGIQAACFVRGDPLSPQCSLFFSGHENACFPDFSSGYQQTQVGTMYARSYAYEELQAELLKLASTKSDYEDVADEIYTLREEKQKVQVDSASKDEIKKRITDMSTFLKEQPTTLNEYDETLVRRLIEKVSVHEDKFTVEFKSGLIVDIME